MHRDPLNENEEIKFEVTGKMENRRESVISDFMDRLSNVDYNDKQEVEEIKESIEVVEKDKSFKPTDFDFADDVSDHLSQASEGQIEMHIKMIEVLSHRANDKQFLMLD